MKEGKPSFDASVLSIPSNLPFQGVVSRLSITSPREQRETERTEISGVNISWLGCRSRFPTPGNLCHFGIDQ